MERLRARRQQLQREDSLRVDQQENALFIPASAGRPLLVPMSLTSSQLTHIYSGASMKADTEGAGYIVSGLGNQFKENTSHRFVCPEIEVAKGNKDYVTQVLNLWSGKTVRDGSLPSTGFEINVMPTQGDLFTRLVNEVCAALEAGGAAVDKSCGLHVHVDARDFDYMDIRKLVKLYELVEPALFSLLPANRHNNRYCQPCGFRFASHLRKGEDLSKDEVAADGKDKKKYDLKAPVHSMVYGKSGKVTRSGKYGSGQANEVRYMGLNLYSWYFRGSIEFRHAPGTINPEHIINWGLTCAGILDTAMAAKEKEIDGMAGEYARGLVEEGMNLYQQAFKPQVKGIKVRDQELVDASTKLLKECVQDRCRDFIDSRQAFQEVIKKTKPQPDQVMPDINSVNLYSNVLRSRSSQTFEEAIDAAMLRLGRPSGNAWLTNLGSIGDDE